MNVLADGYRRLASRLVPQVSQTEVAVSRHATDGEPIGTARVIIRSDSGPIMVNAPVKLKPNYRRMQYDSGTGTGTVIEVNLLCVLVPDAHIYTIEPGDEAAAMVDAQRRWDARRREKMELSTRRTTEDARRREIESTADAEDAAALAAGGVVVSDGCDWVSSDGDLMTRFEVEYFGEESHTVDVRCSDSGYPQDEKCDCSDFNERRRCRHTLAVYARAEFHIDY